MKSKKKQLKESRLYCIIDKKILRPRDIFNTALKIKNKGVDIIQLRDKELNKEVVLNETLKLTKLLKNSKTVFIINDYLDIAKMLDCDGIHLGQDDASIEIARRILGKEKIIGMSCHNLTQAISAQKKGADYISIGPIFPTPTKSEYKAIGLSLIKRMRKKIKIPFFAIGGINENNINDVLSSGAERVAICSAICRAKNIAGSIANLKKVITKT